ncbi:hypothetical protein L226DRAFT_539353 [Lentinus tigrinus ALCF2SS1-7]|uniref:Secreted protein n=1 Tax=Lentinus tigrinus ALCF2SS1-6 TaxID=1328759 RepID=A0A5C2RT49_9APHY|nr:hypothetical protein L227DRAFT_580212 [Lentinus tigrinus ALCF2SS1-6]RPD69902.1 hypothetical protein L226DRAFT_539353 [Lentinus tigrinus ALCF2SS1-7]
MHGRRSFILIPCFTAALAQGRTGSLRRIRVDRIVGSWAFCGTDTHSPRSSLAALCPLIIHNQWVPRPELSSERVENEVGRELSRMQVTVSIPV